MVFITTVTCPCPPCSALHLETGLPWMSMVHSCYSHLFALGRRQWHPTPVLLPGKSRGQRSLVGCSPWVEKSQTRLSGSTFTFYFHALEKEMATHSNVLAWRIPGMGGAWWAAIYGIAQSRTRLMWLSSSSKPHPGRPQNVTFASISPPKLDSLQLFFSLRKLNHVEFTKPKDI